MKWKYYKHTHTRYNKKSNCDEEEEGKKRSWTVQFEFDTNQEQIVNCTTIKMTTATTATAAALHRSVSHLKHFNLILNILSVIPHNSHSRRKKCCNLSKTSAFHSLIMIVYVRFQSYYKHILRDSLSAREGKCEQSEIEDGWRKSKEDTK